jgi:hypothetical protein
VQAVAFEQAAIEVQKKEEFAQLKSVIVRTFAPDRVKQLLKQVERAGVRIRDFDLVLARGVFERVDPGLADSGHSAKSWYDALTVTDQAQMKEFYLFKLEEVSPELRAKFQKLYQYY